MAQGGEEESRRNPRHEMTPGRPWEPAPPDDKEPKYATLAHVASQHHLAG